MAQVFFHCSNAQGKELDLQGADVQDLPELREHAERIVRTLIVLPTLEDWRGWALHVSDEEGRELFEIPFAPLLGRPH